MPLYNPRTTITGVAGSNTAPSYSEGTFTPTVTFATPSGQTIVYSAQLGFYQRVGNVVFYSGQVATSTFTHSSTGNIIIGGLPFTVNAAAVDRGQVQISTSHTWPASVTQMSSVPIGGTSTIELRGIGSGTAVASIGAATFTTGNNINIGFVGCYRV